MTYRILIEPTAASGIREAVRWIAATRSDAAAAKWFNALGKKIGTLGDLPGRCPIAREDERFAEEIRELLHGSKKQRYRILFTIRGDAVHVLYVRHSAQDDVVPDE